MWQVGRISTGSRKCKYRDVDYENGMSIILCTIPAALPLRGAHTQLSACPSGVEPAWVPCWNPHPVRQAFFNTAFNWDSSSLQSTFSQHHCPPAKLMHESTGPLCHFGWLLGYTSVCLVLLWWRSPVQDEKSAFLRQRRTQNSVNDENKTWFIWIKSHYRDKYLKAIK